ncbi:MAG: hypothetical protein GC185_01765 [Alphaproteobacteria bacterium]|nr:hypothetical protein [Alphaproteobacteria bacterium]
MTPQYARDYISRFHLIIGAPSPISYVDTTAGLIDIENMTDERAVWLARELQRMEAEAGRPEGVPVQ